MATESIPQKHFQFQAKRVAKWRYISNYEEKSQGACTQWVRRRAGNRILLVTVRHRSWRSRGNGWHGLRMPSPIFLPAQFVLRRIDLFRHGISSQRDAAEEHDRPSLISSASV